MRILRSGRVDRLELSGKRVPGTVVLVRLFVGSPRTSRQVHWCAEALPFADDADAAYQRLGEIVRQIDPVESSPVVRAIAAIALRPRRQTEPVDPPGLKSCALALLDVAQKKSLAGAVRAKAISALRLLSEKGAIEPNLIPSDLDAR